MALVGNRQSPSHGRWNQEMVESQPHDNRALGLSPFRGIFVGRQREMGELKAALDDANSGHGRLVMLAGDPGIGKTRTAQELAYYAEARGAKALWGWCYEGEGAPPFWPWVQPLRSYVQQTEPEQLASAMGPGAASYKFQPQQIGTCN